MLLTPDQELNIPDELKAEEELIAEDLVIFHKEKENLVALLNKRDELDEQKNDIENAIHENEIAVEASQTILNDIQHFQDLFLLERDKLMWRMYEYWRSNRLY